MGRHSRPSPARPTHRRRTTAVALSVAAVGGSLLVAPALAQAATRPAPPASFSFLGSGWGHGIGMSQVGARGQAAEGRTAGQILRYYYSGTTVRSVVDDATLRVNLLNMVPTVRLRGEAVRSGGGTLAITVGGRTTVVPPRQQVVLATTAAGVAVSTAGRSLGVSPTVTVVWSGTSQSGAAGRAAGLVNVRGPRGSFDSSGSRYRYGRIEVRTRTAKDGARGLQAVNVVRLRDEYLLGLGEMPSSWPREALRAQAIAARSYALVKQRAGVRGGCWCQVLDGTGDQVFVGWSKEAGVMGSRWREAVLSTVTGSRTALAVTYRGKVAQAFYSASTGGRTQNSEDVWGSRVGYLRSVADPWSRSALYNPAHASWGPLVRSQQLVARSFGLPDVARIEVTSRYASGSVKQVTAWSSRGVKAVLPGGRATARLGLTSRWFRLAGAPDPLAPAPDPVAAAVLAARSVPTTSRTVVISRIGSRTEGLRHSLLLPLQARVDAPLLLTTGRGVPAATANEITRRGARTAYLLGSPGWITKADEARLRALGIRTVIRMYAADRYALSARIAQVMNVPKGRAAFAVNGTDPTRIGVAAALASRTDSPLVLVRPRAVPPPVAAYLLRLSPRSTTLVGPTSSVSNDVLRALPRGTRLAR